MPLISLTSGLSFEYQGNSILEAAALAGVTLPHSCKTGRCTTCKCRVLSGVSQTDHAETGLSEEEKALGWILSCVRSAESDLALEVDDLGSISLPAVKTLPCRIVHLGRPSSDVIQVMLRLPPGSRFNFIAGQYIDLIGPNGVRRSYSLANAPRTDNTLELHIRTIDGGVMSEYFLNRAQINDLLRLNGPLGTFFLRDTAQLNLVYLATGTGIAPVKAMLESMRDLPSGLRPRSVSVFWGGRAPQDLYFDLAKVNGVENFVPVLSRADSNWTGARGHVQQALLNMNSDLGDLVVYACGSDAMIRDAKEILIENGLSAKRFYSDAFVCSSS